MKETDHIRKLMEAVETPYRELPEGSCGAKKKKVDEDWGSSDWYSVIKSMDEYIDKHGMNPETIMDAAREAAVFWGDQMGHDMSTRDGEEGAIQDCKDGWVRMSERGQQLARMFAPVDEGKAVTEDGDQYDNYDLNVETDAEGNEYVMIMANVNGADQVVLEMSGDQWIQLANKYIRIHRTR